MRLRTGLNISLKSLKIENDSLKRNEESVFYNKYIKVKSLLTRNLSIQLGSLKILTIYPGLNVIESLEGDAEKIIRRDLKDKIEEKTIIISKIILDFKNSQGVTFLKKFHKERALKIIAMTHSPKILESWLSNRKNSDFKQAIQNQLLKSKQLI